MTIQSDYRINPTQGFPGDLAQPNFPHAYDSGLLHVPGGATRNPRPGDQVYYDEAENAWAIPTNAAQSLLASGILTYRKDVVQTSEQVTEFKDGAEVEIGVLGSFWVTADAAVEYGQKLVWDRASYKWEPAPALDITPLANLANNQVATINASIDTLESNIEALVQSLGRVPVVCVSRTGVAANGIAIARIGYGRIN